MRKPNYSIYSPEHSYSDGPNYMTLNIQFLLKIQSNLKLNIIDLDGNSMIQGDEAKKETEIHFLKVESVMGKYELNLKTVRRLFHEYRNPKDRPSYMDWYVVDFDNHLEGNPHIQDIQVK